MTPDEPMEADVAAFAKAITAGDQIDAVGRLYAVKRHSGESDADMLVRIAAMAYGIECIEAPECS